MISTIFLQAGPEGSGFGSLFLIGGFLLIFYFFMLRPQQKKQKDQKNFQEALKKGDKVVTIGGIHGKIVAVDESTVTVDIDRGTKIQLDKTAISSEASASIVAE